MYKMLSSDIDGTILNSQGKLIKENIEVVKKLIDKGIIVSLCTGRNISRAVPIAKKLGIKAPIVCIDGILLYDTQLKRPVNDMVMDFNTAVNIIEIGKILKYPDKIEVDGDGNKEFNNGSKFNYAYQILKVYELENPITLEVLKQRFDFVPPQAFTYDTRYPDLSDYLLKAKKHIVVENFTIK